MPNDQACGCLASHVPRCLKLPTHEAEDDHARQVPSDQTDRTTRHAAARRGMCRDASIAYTRGRRRPRQAGAASFKQPPHEACAAMAHDALSAATFLAGPPNGLVFSCRKRMVLLLKKPTILCAQRS